MPKTWCWAKYLLQDLKRLKELEDENRKLKKMFADVSLQNMALKDVIEKKL
jgi:putative transposase